MVNDGSTDSSNSICEEFVSRDDRFVLINQENGGSASARRNGMLHAKGEYIGFVDSDDWSEANMFKKMYETAKEYDVDDEKICKAMYGAAGIGAVIAHKASISGAEGGCQAEIGSASGMAAAALACAGYTNTPD